MYSSFISLSHHVRSSQIVVEPSSHGLTLPIQSSSSYLNHPFCEQVKELNPTEFVD